MHWRHDSGLAEVFPQRLVGNFFGLFLDASNASSNIKYYYIIHRTRQPMSSTWAQIQLVTALQASCLTADPIVKCLSGCLFQ